jgi:hypothetical protein
MTTYRYPARRVIEPDLGTIRYDIYDFPDTFGRGETEDEAQKNAQGVLKGLALKSAENLPPASTCQWNEFLIVVDTEDDSIDAVEAPPPAAEAGAEDEATEPASETPDEEIEPGGGGASADIPEEPAPDAPTAEEPAAEPAEATDEEGAPGEVAETPTENG